MSPSDDPAPREWGSLWFPSRLVIDPLGNRYVATVAPTEGYGPGGVEPYLVSVVFETDSGEWAGMTTISTHVQLEHLSEEEIVCLLAEALEDERT